MCACVRHASFRISSSCTHEVYSHYSHLGVSFHWSWRNCRFDVPVPAVVPRVPSFFLSFLLQRCVRQHRTRGARLSPPPPPGPRPLTPPAGPFEPALRLRPPFAYLAPVSEGCPSPPRLTPYGTLSPARIIVYSTDRARPAGRRGERKARYERNSPTTQTFFSLDGGSFFFFVRARFCLSYTRDYGILH